MKKWTKEDWGTKSGKNSTEGKGATGERYLPKKARAALTDEEYNRSSAKKRASIRKGQQHSKQPDSSDVASERCRLRAKGRLALSKGYSGVHDQPQKPTLGCTALDKTRLHNCSQTAAVQAV